MEICVWTYLGLRKWRTTSKKNKKWKTTSKKMEDNLKKDGKQPTNYLFLN
jgi:hypothetical protein